MFDKKDNYESDYIRHVEEYSPHEDSESSSESESEDAFSSVLTEDEEILWTGVSKGTSMQRQARDIAVFGIIVIFLTILAFIVPAAVKHGWQQLILAVPVLLFAFFNLAALAFASKTYYAVTQRRVLRKSGRKILWDMHEDIISVELVEVSAAERYVAYTVMKHYGGRNSFPRRHRAVIGGVDCVDELYRIMKECSDKNRAIS